MLIASDRLATSLAAAWAKVEVRGCAEAMRTPARTAEDAASTSFIRKADSMMPKIRASTSGVTSAASTGHRAALPPAAGHGLHAPVVVTGSTRMTVDSAIVWSPNSQPVSGRCVTLR